MKTDERSPYEWPDIFRDQSLMEGMSDLELCANGLCGWGLVHCGPDAGPLPPLFGNVMAEIGRRLKCSATGDALMAWSKAHMPQQQEAQP